MAVAVGEGDRAHSAINRSCHLPKACAVRLPGFVLPDIPFSDLRHRLRAVLQRCRDDPARRRERARTDGQARRGAPRGRRVDRWFDRRGPGSRCSHPRAAAQPRQRRGPRACDERSEARVRALLRRARTCSSRRSSKRRCPGSKIQRVAAVFGRITQPPARTAAERWRGRHLFKVDLAQELASAHRCARGGRWCARRRSGRGGGYDRRCGTRRTASSAPTARGGLRRRVRPAARGDVDRAKHARPGAGAPLALVRDRRKPDGELARVPKEHRLFDQVHGDGRSSRAGDPLSVPVSLLSPALPFWRSWRTATLRCA